MAEAATAWWKRLGALSGATLALLIALVVVTAAADRSGVSLDLSADRRFTLHPRLIELVRQQTEPVAITGFWGQADLEALAGLATLCERVGNLQPLVTWKRLDPELHKPLVAAFAQTYGDAQPGTIAVTRGKRLYRIDLTPGIRLTLQRELGAALVTLADTDPPQAHLITGHGELRPDGGLEHGSDRLGRLLTQAGFRTIVRTPATAVPPSPTAIVVVPGPTSPVGDRDLDLMDQHLRDGGGLLVLADDRAPADLRTWLRRHGVVVGGLPQDPDPREGDLPSAQIVVSLTRHQAGQEVRFPYHNLLLEGRLLHPGHPITSPLAAEGVPLLSPWTAPVWLLDPQVVAEPQATALRGAYAAIGTRPFGGLTLAGSAPGDAWTKPRAAPLQDPEGLEKAPPLPLAVAVDYAPAVDSVQAGIGGRMVVWGSRQAASDGILAQTAFANEGLWRHAADWLARRSPPSDIPPTEMAAFQVQASDGTLSLLTGLLLILIPCVCLGWAMLMWWDRR